MNQGGLESVDVHVHPLQALESGGLRAALMAAVEAATRRSVELGARK